MRIDLIEQLGGYENSKGLFSRYDHAITFKYYPNYVEDSNNFVDVFVPDLKQALLQYRREHNIFEVRDYVFLRDSHFTELWIVTNILKDGSIEIKTTVHGYPVPSKCWGMYYGKSNGLIHATNEEIQAGRRLEVCGG